MRDKKQKKRWKKSLILYLGIMLLLVLSGCSKGEDSTDTANVITDLDQLDGQVIALPEGASYDITVQERFPNSEYLYFPTYVDCATAVQNGKAAAYVAEESMVIYQKEKTAGFTYLSEALSQENCAYMMGKDNTELAQEINQTLAELSEEGVLKELEAEWIYGEGTQSVDYDPNADTSKGTLKIITCSDAEPFCFLSNGEVAGYEVELIVKIAERLGYGVEFSLADFSALIPAVVNGKMDLALGCIAVTEERKESVGFSDPEYFNNIVVVVQDGTKAETSFLDSIKASFERTFVKENRWKMIRDGLIVTVELSVLSLIFGSVLGFAVSFPLRSKNNWIRKISNAISTILSGIPMVVLLMVLYYVVFKSLDISPFWIGVVGFSIDFANTVAGLLNTGVLAVDKGELEAASSMGYNKFQIFCKVTFPQAAKQMFSQYEGAVGGLIKSTSIVGYITVEDLTKASDLIRSRTYEAFFPLIVTAVLYFVIAQLIIAILSRVDIKLDPKRRPRKVKGVQIHDKN